MAVRAGRLDRLIDIQRYTRVVTPRGDVEESWAEVSGRRAAGYRPLKADERLSGPEVAATEQVEFRIRYSANVADLTAKDRIIYPAMNEGDADIPTNRIFDILGVSEVGRREALLIIGQRRPDVTP